MQTNLQTVALAIVSACQGKGLAFAMLKDQALADPDGFAPLVEACTARLWEQFPDFNGKSLSAMQVAKVPGASTLYTYSITIGKMLREGKMVDLADLNASKMTAKRVGKKAEDKKADEKAPVESTRPATVEDLIATLHQMHTAGALTTEHYAALALITPPAPVKAPAKTGTKALAQA